MTITHRRFSLALAGVLPVLALAGACRGNQTTASKSAAEFDAAQKRGMTPGTGEAHGAHGQAAEVERSPGPSNMPGMDHSGMPGMGGAPAARPGAKGAASIMPGMDHSRMPGMAGAPPARPGATAAGSSMAGMDHSRMPGMAGAPAAHPAPTGMDHSNMAQPPGMAVPPPLPERPVAVAVPGQPSATLRPDEIDSPAPTAVREAARAATMAMEMAGGSGHGMQHGVYRQIDAGREDVTPPPKGGHGDHQPAPSLPSSSADPHRQHAVPAPPATPSSAGGHQHAAPRTAPAPDPRSMHATPATPKPTAQPSPRATPSPRPKEDNR
jgi:hypothetical protein